MHTEDLALAHRDAMPGDHLTEAGPPSVTLARPQAARPAAMVPSPMLDTTQLQPNEAAGFLILGTDHWALLREQCTELVKGNALHSSIGTPARAAMIGMKAIEMGIPLTAAFSGFRFIDGELCMLGKLLLRLIQQRAIPKGAVCRPIKVPFEEQSKRAGWLMGRAGQEAQEYWFTMEMAEQAELLKVWSRKANNGEGGYIESLTWKRYPQRMLRWRALAEGANYEFQDILQGCLLAEEMSHKDPLFIEGSLQSEPEDDGKGRRPSFADGMPQRNELPKDHAHLVELGELMSTWTTISSQLAGLAGDTIDDGWYDRNYQEKRKALCKRCVRGRFPTEGEAKTMKQILHDELRMLKEQLANATVPPPAKPPRPPREGTT